MLIFATIILLVILSVFVCLIIDKHSNSKWFCNFWGWHHPHNNKIGFDGCSMTSKCKRCNKDILCDSNGDWF